MKNELIAATTTALLTAALMVPAVRAGATESGGWDEATGSFTTDSEVGDAPASSARILDHRGIAETTTIGGTTPRASPRLDDVDGRQALNDRAQGELFRQRGLQLVRSPLRDERHRGALALEGSHSEHRPWFGPDLLRTMIPRVPCTPMRERPACSLGARTGGSA